MGLLSNPSLTQRNKLGRNLAKHKQKLCFLLYVAGIAWFFCLSHPELNHSTYLSENALSPGLVYLEVKQDSFRLAHTLMEELRHEREVHQSDLPKAWLLAKMRQIGLETHEHNFTLNYPFGGGKVYHGTNIYGIIRAPRIGSTEGIVFSTPYRPPISVHADISAGVPLLLAFADFARKKNYWAKDLVFLITEQEQLGAHAWLEAYHNGAKSAPHDILYYGDLPARAGALQAAVNLEIQSLDVDYIDVKIEGLNGQLPNLDMFNLVQRITSREGVVSGYKLRPRQKRRSLQDTLRENINNMAAMLVSQATGVPNGNHGLFLRYRIESLTLEAIKRPTPTNNHPDRLALLKTLEGILRSLNNLLERFHQSYFFYILVQNDRFVSIGDFMPCVMLMAGAVLAKAFLLWLSVDECVGAETTMAVDGQKQPPAEPSCDQSLVLPYKAVLLYIGVTFLLGVSCNFALPNETVSAYLFDKGVKTEVFVGACLACFSLLCCFAPLILKLERFAAGLYLLHIGSLMALGVTLIMLGLLNFSLGFITAIICCPLAILVDPTGQSSVKRLLLSLYALLLNPMIAIFTIVSMLALFEFSNSTPAEISLKALAATLDAFTFSLMDSIFYGNWLYNVMTAILLPIWTLFWTLCLARSKTIPKEKLS